MAKTNGHAVRKLKSWIDSFVESTENLDSPGIFRRWAAITALAAVLEQKVWLMTSSPIFPNLYVILTGHPGTGKTRSIRRAREYLHELPEFLFAPKSFTFPSLIDTLVKSKRMLIRLPDPPMEYNTALICADELGTFMHKFDEEMSKGISALYDPDPYTHTRRGKDIDIKLKSPQLNILSGVTPTDLVKTLPESAWGQGFTSRVIFIFSDERIVGDDFAPMSASKALPDLIHDLKLINTLVGEFKVTEDYRNLVNAWRQAGETMKDYPAPSHPRLIHYNARRKVNLYKLSMISVIDRSDVLLLTREDFNRAMGWLVEAEALMPEIFKAGAINADAAAMDEIYHFTMTMDTLGTGVSEHKIVGFARDKVPAHSVMRVLEIMNRSGMIKAVSVNKMGITFWKAVTKVQGFQSEA